MKIREKGKLMTFICSEVQPLLPVFPEVDKLQTVLKVTGRQVLEVSTSMTIFKQTNQAGQQLPAQLTGCLTLPKSRTSKRSKGSKSSLLRRPNLSWHTLRNVRMFFRHRNCGIETEIEKTSLTAGCPVYISNGMQ